jgi:hypothetical protein
MKNMRKMKPFVTSSTNIIICTDLLLESELTTNLEDEIPNSHSPC